MRKHTILDENANAIDISENQEKQANLSTQEQDKSKTINLSPKSQIPVSPQQLSAISVSSSPSECRSYQPSDGSVTWISVFSTGSGSHAG